MSSPEESLLSRGILTEGALCLASISLMKQQELIQTFIMGPFQTMQQAWCQMGTRVHFVAAWSSSGEKYLPCAEHQAH